MVTLTPRLRALGVCDDDLPGADSWRDLEARLAALREISARAGRPAALSGDDIRKEAERGWRRG